MIQLLLFSLISKMERLRHPDGKGSKKSRNTKWEMPNDS